MFYAQGWSQVSFKTVIVVVTCLYNFKNLKKCLGLFLILFCEIGGNMFPYFLENVFPKDLKMVQFSGVLYICV